MYVIGLDFGTDSVRAIVVDPADGRILSRGSAVFPRFQKGLYCDATKRQFRQHPLDHLEAMEAAVKAALAPLSEEDRKKIGAIGTDTTGATVAPVDAEGTPLVLLPEFAEDPEAMFHLWKDHVSSAEGKELNDALRHAKVDYLRYQGDYMGEWTYAKVLRVVRERPDICEKAASFVELSDWIPAVLCGNTAPETIYHSINISAHKMLYHPALGGYPDSETMDALHPGLGKFIRSMHAPEPATKQVGLLTEEWRMRFGLEGPVLVSGSSLDASAGAVGSGVRPGVLVKVLGTSGCDLSVAPEEEVKDLDLSKVTALAKDSILPGYYALESGQAAFGDLFDWVRRLLLWTTGLEGTSSQEYRQMKDALLPRLEEEAAKRPLTKDTPVMLDWLNGRRYPVDDALAAGAADLRIGHDAVDLYRAVALGAIFGSRAILDGYAKNGIYFDQVIACGGIPARSPYLMQLLADSFQKPVMVEGSGESCALGASMYAAVAAGIYPDLLSAQDHMCAPFRAVYTPDPTKKEVLDALYEKYQRLGKFQEAELA